MSEKISIDSLRDAIKSQRSDSEADNLSQRFEKKAKKFERAVGGRWTGIIFHRGYVSNKHMAKHPMRFCEEIKKSSTGPLTLTKQVLN